VVPAEEVRQKLGVHSLLGQCQSGPCLSDVAAKLSADRLIVAHIEVKGAVGGSAYNIELKVFDQAGTPLPMNSNENCGDDSDGCNLTRAYETLRRASANIAGMIVAEKAPPPKPPQVAAAPPPPPAELQLKDPTAPETPPAVTPPPPVSTPVETPAPVSTRPYNPAYRYGWIAALAGGGALTIIASAPFLYFASREGDTNCGPSVPRNQCPQVYQGNLAPGLGLLIGGAALTAGTFGVLFYLDRKEQRRARPTALLPVRTTGGVASQLVGAY
jgi:hypothetical protein